MVGFSPTLLKMEILSDELVASALSLAHLFLGFIWCPWPWAVGIFPVQSAWDKLKVMSQPTRVRFSQHSTCDVQCIAWGKLQGSVGCLQARIPTRAVTNSTEQRRPNLSLVYPHYHPQSGVQVWQSREDGANLDPCSEDDEKPNWLSSWNPGSI